jgi:long-chain fatty acid transport protein
MALSDRIVLGTATLVLAAHGAWASDGYFSHGYGTDHKAMAGAGVALSLGSQTVATNPAAAAFLPGGLDLDIAVFNPNRQHTVTGAPSGYPGTFGLAPGTVKSDSKYFPVPGLGASRKVGKNGVFAVLAYGNGGMNTNYPAPVFGVSPAGINLTQMFLAPTYAHKLGGGKHALGLSAIFAYQRFEAKGLAAFSGFSSDPANLTNNKAANSFGAGLRVGYQGQLAPWLTVGLSYQTRVVMSKFDSYAGLFAEQGGFDVPQNVTGGLALKATKRLTAALDVQWINYSGVRSVGNALLPNLMAAKLGDDAGAGFEWQDMTIYRGGLQYDAGGGWMFRTGYSYGKQPIPTQAVLMNILAPGVIEHHVSAGFSKTVRGRHGIHLAVTRALSKSVTGPNVLEAPGQQTIELTMDQWDVSLGYSLGF